MKIEGKYQNIQYKLDFMKKNLGIVRNRKKIYDDYKEKIIKRKTRFLSSAKEIQQASSNTHSLKTIQISSCSDLIPNQTLLSQQTYLKAKQILKNTSEIQLEITNLSRARLVSFKQSQNARYDQRITKLASTATNNLISAESCLKELSNIVTNCQSQKKFVKNMEKSLAQEIRQASRSLRQQEKEYFDRIRLYERNTINTAIQLTPNLKQTMHLENQQMLEQQNDLNNQNIDGLVKSINKLSVIYKELNQLVIEQGSIIDRIDINIDCTVEHTSKAVIHLEAANEASSSSFADNVIKALVIMILIFAAILGLQHMY